MAAHSLSVIIPCYNEAARLTRTLPLLRAYLEHHGWDYELLVVDDGSTDGTRAAALRVGGPRLRLLGWSANRGKGAAVALGLRRASKPAVLYIDADLSTKPAMLSRLWPLLAIVDVVVGSRAVPGAQIEVRQPWPRRVLGQLFRRLVQVWLPDIHDSQCGFKLLRRDVAHTLGRLLRTDGFCFDIELLLLARQHHYRMAECPVTWSNDADSRVCLPRDGLRMLLDLFAIVRRGARRANRASRRAAALGPPCAAPDAQPPTQPRKIRHRSARRIRGTRRPVVSVLSS